MRKLWISIAVAILAMLPAIYFRATGLRPDPLVDAALQECDLFVSIGTSGAVYPAAGFVQTARYCGARTLELNLEPSQSSIFFDESRIGQAGELVPAWAEEMLAPDRV